MRRASGSIILTAGLFGTAIAGQATLTIDADSEGTPVGPLLYGILPVKCGTGVSPVSIVSIGPRSGERGNGTADGRR